MSVIEAVTVTLYRVKPEHRPEGWRKGKPRRQKALAYRDAAWAKLRRRCRCTYQDFPDDPPGKSCRYHDKEHRAEDHGYGEGGWHGFLPPHTWGLPRRYEPGFWDYGRAVAFRLARFYAHLDSKARAPSASTPGSDQGAGTGGCTIVSASGTVTTPRPCRTECPKFAIGRECTPAPGDPCQGAGGES